MWEAGEKKKNWRDHSNVKNGQMLVFKMESGGHKLKSKASVSKVRKQSKRFPPPEPPERS